MAFLRAHLISTAVIVAAVALTGGVFVVIPPTAKRAAGTPPPPGDGLPYTRVVYSTGDARRAFAGVGVPLVRGARTPGIVDLHTRALGIEVTVFGVDKVVDASGFSDYYTVDANGNWVLAPKTCGHGARNAERWRGNVRAIVLCNAGAGTNLRSVSRGLAALPQR